MFEGIEGMKAYRGKIEADYDRRQSAHKDTVIDRLNAEITQLRAELAAERELADGLAHDLKGLLASYQEPDKLMCCNGQMCGCRGASERDMAEHFATEALTAHATRRKK